MHSSIHQQVASSEGLEALPSSKEEESKTQEIRHTTNALAKCFCCGLGLLHNELPV